MYSTKLNSSILLSVKLNHKIVLLNFQKKKKSSLQFNFENVSLFSKKKLVIHKQINQNKYLLIHSICCFKARIYPFDCLVVRNLGKCLEVWGMNRSSCYLFITFLFNQVSWSDYLQFARNNPAQFTFSVLPFYSSTYIRFIF